ncbi:unnamed protein product [Gongylonema pulchrum]|uniref:PLAT domain-containing protein n=1 Tax=Gongylonema pulchrum TaxID=637853 RepID=A0A3P7MBU7_9BILA|nr:unnamed protein product [Gongylonema pulchrum]
MYKRYAFLRCDDEKEQFLYHILSLNAADFYCFTNTFKKTKMLYRVLLVTGSSRSALSCPIWIIITGSLCSTTTIALKQGIFEFTFDHKNLGMLSTLRIGHGDSACGAPPKWFLDYHKNLGMLSTLRIGHGDSACGAPPKWFLDYILVRNEITGQSYRFNCGRWFGKGVDDGSLERLLVAEKQPQMGPGEALSDESSSDHTVSKTNTRSRTPPRSRSPSTSRSESSSHKSSRLRLNEIQQQLGEAVNALVKYFYANAEARSRGELTQLLCAPGKGFVKKVCKWFWDLMHMEDSKRLTREQRLLIMQACNLARRISANTFLGKDGKFQLDHILSGLLPLMAWTPITSQMYDQPSFLRTPHYLNYLSKLISSLNEFQFTLEKSLTYGVE